MFILIPFCLLMLSIACDTCIPLGPRIFLGQSYFPTVSSNETLRVLFNTHSKCQLSYINVKQGDNSFNVVCPIQLLEISSVNYSTYIHNCSLNNIKLGKDFTYKVVAVDKTGVETTWKNTEITTSLIDPTVFLKIFRLMLLINLLCSLTGEK